MGPTELTHWQLEVPLPPEQVLAALVDFSPRREVIWKETCDPAVYRVHALGDTWAEATEGVSYAWSRERYDWSEPGLVTLTQLEANIAEPVGTIRYTITPLPDGGARIACDRYRVFRGPRGRLLGSFMDLFGPRILRSQFKVALGRISHVVGWSGIDLQRVGHGPVCAVLPGCRDRSARQRSARARRSCACPGSPLVAAGIRGSDR